VVGHTEVVKLGRRSAAGQVGPKVANRQRLPAQPTVQSLAHKIIVCKMRIEPADTIDFFTLPWRQLFIRIETPASRQQALAAQDFVDARYAAMKAICRIE
jgi:hypothetical protein